MKPLQAAFTALILAGSALGDVTVNFRNDVLPDQSQRLVYFGPTFGPFSDTPVVNDIPAGVSYVAQLFFVQGGAFTAVGDRANLLTVPQTDPLAGTWGGANRVIVGLAEDATVTLAVRVWDDVFASFDAAVAGGGGFGESAVFTYRNALSSPPVASDTYMVNFQGVCLSCVPEPSTYALAALGLGGLLLWSRRKH